MLFKPSTTRRSQYAPRNFNDKFRLPRRSTIRCELRGTNGLGNFKTIQFFTNCIIQCDQCQAQSHRSKNFFLISLNSFIRQITLSASNLLIALDNQYQRRILGYRSKTTNFIEGDLL